MSKFQISPNVQFGIGLAVTLLTVLSKGSVSMPMGVPPIWGQYIDSWSNFLLLVYAPVATFMAAYASSQPGFLAPPDSPAVKAVTAKEDAAAKAAAGIVKMLLIGLLAASLLSFGAPTTARAAGAEGISLTTSPVIRPPSPFATPGAGALPSPGQVVSTIFKDLIDYFTNGIDQALTMSTAVPSIQDGNGHDCAVAGQTLMSVLQVHPQIISGHIAADVEGLRITVVALQQICASHACQQVFSEADNAIATLGVGITIPGFEALCAKLPNVAIVAPQSTPLPTPLPTPTSSPSPSPTGN